MARKPRLEFCDEEEYLLNLIKYIHNNPVRAKLTEDADGYPWSSHRLFLKPKTKGIVETHIALGHFSEDIGQGMRLYRRFMGEEGISKRELEKTFDQRILGDDEFVARILDKEQEKVLPRKRKHEFGLEGIARGIEDVCGISGEELLCKGRRPESVQARSLFCSIAKGYGYKGVEIGRFLGRDPGAISKYLRHGEKLEGKMEKVVSALKKQANFNIQA